MFLWRLNAGQRKIFMAVATLMAMADAKVPPEEVRLLDDFAASLDTNISAAGEAVFSTPDYGIFDTDEARTIMVLGILAVALSDDHFHVDESAVLNQVTDAFGIEPGRLQELRAWAERIVDIYNDFHDLIETDTSS
jgi:tellurite resistance protein